MRCSLRRSRPCARGRQPRPWWLSVVSSVAEEAGRTYFLYDTSIPGNFNRGHVYGTGLTPEEKDAIVEYLKTF